MEDLCELKRHIYGDTVDRSAITRFVDLLFPSCDCREKYEKRKKTNENDVEDDEFFKQKLDESELEFLFADDLQPEEDLHGSRVENIADSHDVEDEMCDEVDQDDDVMSGKTDYTVSSPEEDVGENEINDFIDYGGFV